MSDQPVALSPLAKRIARLIDLRVGGNQRAFAQQTNISQATLSRVLSGKSEPGAKLLSQLTALPWLNPEWLTRGVGTPILDSTSPNTVPLVSALLNTPPSRLSLSPETERRRVPIDTQDAYAIRAEKCSPAVSDRAEQMQEDDLIVIETDPECRHGSEQIAGRLCVVRPSPESDLSLLRVSVRLDGETGDTRLTVPTVMTVHRRSREAHESLGEGRSISRPLRYIQLHPGPPPSQERPKKPEEIDIRPEDIYGIAMTLIRSL